MPEHTICIDAGTISFIYADDLVGLLDEGEATVRRVSHVEPIADSSKGWSVDMSPVDGPSSIGPFRTREEALSAEVQWLRERRDL